MVEMWCDGGMIGRRNPSPEGVYWSVGIARTGEPYHVERYESSRHRTNNDAEWLALLSALTLAADRFPHESVLIRSDSQLVVNQFLGIYRCKERKFAEYRDQAYALEDRIEQVTIEWVPRKIIVRQLGH